MLENQYPNSQPLPKSTSWIITNFNENDNKQRVVRKFINSAIYVEKEITEMVPQRKTSSLIIDSDESSSKKCSCTSFRSCCSCQGINKQEVRNYFSNSGTQLKNKPSFCQLQKTPESGYNTMELSPNEYSDISSSSESTVKPTRMEPLERFNSELRLSLSCLNTNRTITLDPKERQEIVQNWITKKEQEKKRKAQEEALRTKQKEEERQMVLEKERDNFKRWLADKKKKEEQKKAKKEFEEEEKKLREAEKEKKKVENEISYNLWLRRKRKDDLEKRITEKLALLNVYEEKQRRMEENERAYQEWLETSKNRQKPIPMNKGLKSLCSSASITYINPIPWTPNIQDKPSTN